MVMNSPVWKDLSKHEGISFITDDSKLGEVGTKFLRNASLNFYRYNLLGGHLVAQLVEVLRYKPEGRGFDSR